jgi:ABC-type glutathione transport system ATPase component
VADRTLEIRGLKVEYPSPQGQVQALKGVSIYAEASETVAIVGESGCGKTTLARAILGLAPVTEGEIVFGGHRSESRSILAERIGMVWQDPYASLDPRWTVARSLEEPFRLAKRTPSIGGLLESVGLPPEMANRHPHQLSGGQRQRVAIARALALHPPLLICDEPTAALDLSIQAQILNLLRDIQLRDRCSVLYISHDLATVRFIADRIYVMNQGLVVEEGRTVDVFNHPQDPYTKSLLASALTLEELGRLP